MNFSPFEIIMLCCFGAAWPASIIKSWKSRTTAGKSILFLAGIFIGYIGGILHKILYSTDIVLLFYILNCLMVAADILIYVRNRKIDSHSGR